MPAALALAAFLAVGGARAADVSLATGPAVVIDASHLEIAGRRFKFYGIEAPDLDETCLDAQGKEYACGLEARKALGELVKDAPANCLPRGPDQNNETLGTCSVGKVDLAQALIDAGWAVSDRTRSLYYENSEEKARIAKRGLWQGQFVPPADWRAGERVPQSRKGLKGSGPGALF